AVFEGEHLTFTTQPGRVQSEVTFIHFEVARPSWLRRRKMASPARGFVLRQTKTLALRFFFNEAFRFDAQTYADGKHQNAPRVSVQNSREPARHFGLSAAGVPPIFEKTLSRFVFARRTERLQRRNFVCRRGMGRRRDRRTPHPRQNNRAADCGSRRKHGSIPGS